MADIGVVVGELAGLRGDGVGDLGAAVADVDAVETGEGVEEALAVAVLDVDAGAAGDDARGGLAAGVLGEVGGGVEEGLAVPEGELVVGQHVIGSRCKKLTYERMYNGMYIRMYLDSRPGTCSAPVAADVFHLHEGLHPEAGALAAEAGLLEAAEGDRARR